MAKKQKKQIGRTGARGKSLTRYPSVSTYFKTPTSISSSSPNPSINTITGGMGKKRIREEVEEEEEDTTRSSRKGKKKNHEEEEKEDADSIMCGICLLEEGKAVRGQIDCCNHYFCYVCIMEWAKKESLCPMCKQRFRSIRRPPKDGVFARERIFEVPVRDQVYNPLRNVSRGPSNPHACVYCTECKSCKDECLLLLCDLCTSAMRTFCVGLGVTVPEGNWYCHDCTIARNEHTKRQLCSSMEGISTSSSSSMSVPMVEEDNGNSVNAGTSSSSQHKPVITLNAFGLPVGDDSIKMATRCGELVRTHVPISIKDWRAMPKSNKDELWMLLQSYKDKCLKSMSDMFRKYKAKLRTRYLNPHTTHEDRLNNRPPGVKPEDWKAFIEHNSDPKTIEQWKKSTEVRKNLNIYHTSGRHGHARLEEKIKRQKEDDPPLTRAEVWIQAHTRKDGSVPSSVSLHMKRVKELLSSQDEVNSHDILNDPLAHVFDVDTRARVRGVGNVSRTQIVGSSSALEKLAINERKVTEQSTSIKNLESQVDYLGEELRCIKKLIIEQRVASGSQTSTSVPPKMPESVVISNTIGNDRPSMKWRPCKLLSWRKEVVAHGRAYIGDEPQQIHCKFVLEDSYKIIINVVNKGDIELPNPDGYNSTLGEVGNGSFVAWPMSFTTFTD